MDPKLYKAAQEGKVSSLPPLERDYLSRTRQNNNIIHIAARSGHASYIEVALRRVPILADQANSQGETPLHVAARFGHLGVVKLLAPRTTIVRVDDAVVNIETNVQGRPTLEVGGLADQAVVRLPLWRVMNSEGNTALHEALKNGQENVSLYLLQLDPEMACSVNSAGESLLYLAAEARCEKVMLEILTMELSYSAQGPNRQNASHAAKDCSEKAIDALFRYKPELFKELDGHGKAAIHHAVEANNKNWTSWMLKCDQSLAFLPDTDGFTPILKAATAGHCRLCARILQMCPESIEARNRNGQNILHLLLVLSSTKAGFFFWRNRKIMELINERDDDGNTPLHLAVKNRQHEKARLLVSTPNVNLRAINKEGLTVFDMCQSDYMRFIKQRVMMSHLRRCGVPRGRKSWVMDKGPPIASDADFKAVANTLAVVAVLLVTVTFAAPFTMPGGFSSGGDNLGVAVLIKKAAVKAFILSDTFALCCSTVLLFLMIYSTVGEIELTLFFIVICSRMLKYALCGTVVAFVTGLYTVIASEALWLAIVVCIMGSAVPFLIQDNVVILFATNIWLGQPSLKALIAKLILEPIYVVVLIPLRVLIRIALQMLRLFLHKLSPVKE